jgi:hypothetical protein
MNKFNLVSITFLSLLVIALFSGCTSGTATEEEEFYVELESGADNVEAGKVLELSCTTKLPEGKIPSFKWSSTGGEIMETGIESEADFIAPDKAGNVIVNVTVTDGGRTTTRSKVISILGEGALKTTAEVLIEVDTNTLQGVWVDEEHPEENFVAPLLIKGTFNYDTETCRATAGGNWPNYEMYDDGTHGDEAAGDGIYSILMIFDKSDSKVYFAFDDGSTYRVQWESGIAERLKLAWIKLDDFPDDNSNPAFAPDKDKVLKWDEEMAGKGGIYEPY